MSRSDDALTFLIRAMVYEMWVVGITGFAITLLLYITLGAGITDLFLQVRGVGPTSGEVAQVTIGEEALYLWDPSVPDPEVTPRGLLAEVVRFLDRAGARVIVLDILLDRPEPHDELLADAARSHGAVVGAERYVLSEPASGLHFQPGLVQAYDGAVAGGFANLFQRTSLLSQDLLVRGAPMVRQVTRARVEGTWPNNIIGAIQDDAAVVPSMALTAAWLHNKSKNGMVARVSELEHLLEEKCTTSPLSCDLTWDQLGLPSGGVALTEVMPINFRAPEHSDPLHTVRAADILRVSGQGALMRQLDPTIQVDVPQAYRDVLQGRVVVVGRAGQDMAGDRFITPYAFPAYMEADMAGCRIQAQIVDTLISGRHIRPIQGPWVWIPGLALLAGVVLSFRKTSDRAHMMAWMAVIVGLALFGGLLFRVTDGVSVDVGPPIALVVAGLLWSHVRAWAYEAMAP